MPEQAKEQCSWTGCARPPKSLLIDRTLCLEHFLELAERRVGLINQALQDSSEKRSLPQDALTFLSAVISQSTLLTAEARLLHPRLREQLLDLSTGAADLYKRVRRPPRFARRMLCILGGGIVTPKSPVYCVTVNISQHGACIEVTSPLAVDRVITLQREDNKNFIRARVAWGKQQTSNTFWVGLEFLGQEDFWELGLPNNDRPSITKELAL
jgi:hypothetical protein